MEEGGHTVSGHWGEWGLDKKPSRWKKGGCRWDPSARDFFNYVAKIMHFRHMPAKILPKRI